MTAVARLASILVVSGCMGQIGESTGNYEPDAADPSGSAGGPGSPTGFGGGGPGGAAGTGSGTAGRDAVGGGGSSGTLGSGTAGTGSDIGGTSGGVGGGSGGGSGGGGAIGAGGRGGSGAAGTFGSGGRGGSTGGAIGSGGRGGTTGAGGATSPDGGVDGGTAATFTDIYNNILVPHCSGSSCHNPGSQKGVSFSSQSNAYSAVKSRVTAGNGANSSFYKTVNGGSMPPGGPKLSTTDLAKIKGWIDAGALNN